MLLQAIELALSKAATHDEAIALRPVLLAAHQLQLSEANFEERINENKALRGERPVALTPRRQAEVSAYAADAEEMTAQQLREYATFSSARSIIATLQFALEQDASFWSRAHRKAHRSDSAIVQAFAAQKARLRDEVNRYLSAYPRAES